MLNILRKHGSSWWVKTLLAMILLSFVLFFGYTKFASRIQETHDTIAIVGKESIPRRKFESQYQATLDQMKDLLKDASSANLELILRNNLLAQLIQRELVAQFATQLGLTVTDEKLAKAISENPSLFPDGKFNLSLYEHQFLPSYRQRFGENFEVKAGLKEGDVVVASAGFLIDSESRLKATTSSTAGGHKHGG